MTSERLIGEWGIKIQPRSLEDFLSAGQSAAQSHSSLTQVQWQVVRAERLPPPPKLLLIISTQLYCTAWYIDSSMGRDESGENEAATSDDDVSEAPWDTTETSLRIMETGRREGMTTGKRAPWVSLWRSLSEAECRIIFTFCQFFLTAILDTAAVLLAVIQHFSQITQVWFSTNIHDPQRRNPANPYFLVKFWKSLGLFCFHSLFLIGKLLRALLFPQKKYLLYLQDHLFFVLLYFARFFQDLQNFIRIRIQLQAVLRHSFWLIIEAVIGAMCQLWLGHESGKSCS